MESDMHLNLTFNNGTTYHSVTLHDDEITTFPEVLEQLLPVFGSMGFEVSMATTVSGAVFIVPTEFEHVFDDVLDDLETEDDFASIVDDAWDEIEEDDFPAQAEKVAFEGDEYFTKRQIAVGDIVRHTGTGTQEEVYGYGGREGRSLVGRCGRVIELGSSLGEPGRSLVRWFGWSDGHGDNDNQWWVDDNNLLIED